MRVYPVSLPQNPTLPAIGYALGSSEEMRDSLGGIGRTVTAVTFDCWAKSYEAAHATAASLVAAFDGIETTAGGEVLDLAVPGPAEDIPFEGATDLFGRRVTVTFHHWPEGA